MERVQSAVLGLQLGSTIGAISYSLLFSWWIESLIVKFAWIIALAGCMLFFACTHPYAFIVEATAIIGAF